MMPWKGKKHQGTKCTQKRGLRRKRLGSMTPASIKCGTGVK